MNRVPISHKCFADIVTGEIRAAITWGLLQEGRLMEVGRATILGKYVDR